MANYPVGIANPQIGRFGLRPPNSTTPRGANPQNPADAGVDVPFYASGAVWVLLACSVGYVLVYQTLKR